MALSKKLRFEVFKRDGFRCGYCGQTPPSVVLEIDHIEARSRGGDDNINNLITACFDCNRGKKNIPLNSIPLSVADNMEALREKEDQIKAYRKLVDSIEKRKRKDIDDIDNIYTNHYLKWSFSDSFKNVSLKHFLSKLPKHEVIEALDIAIAKYPRDQNRVILYFCGICWRKIRGQNE